MSLRVFLLYFNFFGAHMTIRLLRVISSLDPKGGGPMEGIRQITPKLESLGVNTTVACLDPPESPWIKDFPCEVRAFGPALSGYLYRKGFVRLLKALAHHNDIVIVHGLWQYHAFAAWRALHNGRVPYLVQTHGMLDPWFKKAYPLKHFKKCLYWPWADYRLLRDAKAVLFTCARERDLARQSFSLYSANEQVIAYGTAGPTGDPVQLRRRFLALWPELQHRRILLFLGRIHPKKGVDLLIEAFAEIANRDPSLSLVVAGPDGVGWQKALELLARDLGVADRICWPGMLTGDDKWAAFYAAEIFCLPSHQENFGIAVAEALACGLPVCISNQVNISSEVLNSGSGLVHSNTKLGTVAAFQQWLNYDSYERQVFGRNARALFEQSFEIGSAARQLRLLIERLGVPSAEV